MSELIDYAETAISKYGINGDNSFEYIGISINNTMSFKTYRKRTKRAMEYLKNTEPYCGLLKLLSKEFLFNNKLSICDFSKSVIENKETFRMVFSLENNQSKRQAENYVINFLSQVDAETYIPEIIKTTRIIQEFYKNDESLLMQLGIEVSAEGHLLGVKYYVGIDKSDVAITSDKLAKLLSLISRNTIDTSDLEQLVALLSEQEYDPVFVGFNIFNKLTETKLYFKSSSFGFQTKQIVEHTNEVIMRYGLDYFISEDDVKALYKMDLFIRGIAIDLDDFNRWRLYLNALPRKIV